MGELKLTLTFFGGKADRHRVPAHKLGSILNHLESDLQNVCSIVASPDPNIDVHDVLRDCKLYVAGSPQTGSLEIPVATPESESKWPEIAAHTYVEALRNLGVSGELPLGLNRSILEHVLEYAQDSEYDGFHLTIPPNGQPEDRITFDKALAYIASQKLAELSPHGPSTIYGHSVTGVMYGLEDQNYSDPSATVIVEVDSGDGKRWICRIPREILPADINEHWKERVMVHGVATLKKYRPQMEVDEIKLLGLETDIDAAVDRFIKSNQELWRGIKSDQFLKQVRERD